MLVKTALLLIAIVGLTAFRAGAGGDENNRFINPPRAEGPFATFDNNAVYNLGSTLNVSWETNFTTISLVLWQQDNAGYRYLIERQAATKTLLWDVALDGKYSINSTESDAPNVFSFEVWETLDDSGQIWGRFLSHRFNITRDDRSIAAAATTGPSNNAATSSPTSKDPNSSWAAFTNEHKPSTVLPASHGLPLDAKIGIGLGVGLGVICLVIAAAVPSLYFWGPSRDEEKNPETQRVPPEESMHPVSSSTGKSTLTTAR